MESVVDVRLVDTELVGCPIYAKLRLNEKIILGANIKG
jgi:hypothetical protein